MYKKIFIIGLFSFCIGGGLLWWIISERQFQEREAEKFKQKYSTETSEYIKLYDEWMQKPAEERTELPAGLDINANKTPAEVLQAQQERLKADTDKLAAGEMTVYPFADDFYGHNWQNRIVNYKKQKELQESLVNCSIVCTSIGGVITGWTILLTIARILIKIIKGLGHAIFSRDKDKKSIEKTENSEKEKTNDDNKEGNEQQQEDEHFSNLSNVLVNSGWKYAGSFGAEQKSGLRQRKRIARKNRSQEENINPDNDDELLKVPKQEELARAQNQDESARVPKQEDNTKLQKQDESVHQKPVDKETVSSENKTESETVITRNIDFAHTTGPANHIDNTLKDLTQQVSAIREYAANQQNRLERFQDGYDWNIIKTFCLRIIRCIDNIETRIEQLSQEDVQAAYLGEIRDELVFTLESSGIEQFKPELNSDYRGQEKIAEAIKEKKESKDPDKKGRIESVLRPGYKFYIDDENVKIVRPAQVRLYA
jgi:hypothetical protein